MDVGNRSEILPVANKMNLSEEQCMTVKEEIDNAQFVDSRETEKGKKRGNWSELPSVSLERIYSFLERKDQVNMSLVCHKWSEGFGSPSVWNTFEFYLTEEQLSIDSYPNMKFVHKYSRMFRHVNVFHTNPRDQQTIDTWCKYFIAFLRILTESTQLISIDFLPLTCNFEDIDNPISAYTPTVSRAISTFLEQQHHLKTVRFRATYFRFHEGVALLRKLSTFNRGSLKHLRIQNFVRYNAIGQERNSRFVQNLPSLADFPYLKTLDTYYTFIFENMVSRQSLLTAKDCKTLKLSKIILEYENSIQSISVFKPASENFRGLTSSDWEFLKQLCPNLEVELIFNTESPSQQELNFLIVPNMPITRLLYRYENFHMRMTLDVLFGHLLACKTNSYLKALELRFMCHVPDLVSPFIPFLPACKELQYLEICIPYPIIVLNLMEYWVYNRPKYLKKVSICISSIDDYECYTSLKNRASKYVSQLKLMGMNIEVNVHFKYTDS